MDSAPGAPNCFMPYDVGMSQVIRDDSARVNEWHHLRDVEYSVIVHGLGKVSFCMRDAISRGLVEDMELPN